MERSFNKLRREAPAYVASGGAVRFAETQPWERGFADYFEREVVPRLVMLEQRRGRAEEATARRRVVSLALLSLGGLVWWWFWREHAVWAAVVGLVVLVVFGAWIGAPAEDYRRARKEILLPALAGFLGELTYHPDGPAVRTFWETGLFGTGYDGSAEDSVSGRVAGHAFHWCELSLTRKTGKSTQVVFRGWALSLDLRGGRGAWALLEAGDRRLAPGIVFSSPWSEGRVWTSPAEQVPARERELAAPSAVRASRWTGSSKRAWLREGAAEPSAEVVEAIFAFERSISPARVEAVRAGSRLFVFVASREDAFEPAGVGVSSLDVADVRDLLRDLWQVRELARRLAGGVLGVEDR